MVGEFGDGLEPAICEIIHRIRLHSAGHSENFGLNAKGTLMKRRRHYSLLCMVAGLAWGAAITPINHWVLDFPPVESLLFNLSVGPFIGYMVDEFSARWHEHSVSKRIGLSLLILYIATSLYGALLGTMGVLGGERVGVIFFYTVMALITLTFSGQFILYWPLAYLTCFLLRTNEIEDLPSWEFSDPHA